MDTTNSAIVRCRINPEVKGQAEEVFASIGISTSEAMRLFLKQVAIRGVFPLELRVPNRKTRSAFEEKNLESVTLQQLQDMWCERDSHHKSVQEGSKKSKEKPKARYQQIIICHRSIGDSWKFTGKISSSLLVRELEIKSADLTWARWFERSRCRDR